MSAQDRKISTGWFGKVKTHELQKARTVYKRTTDATPVTLDSRELPDGTCAFFEATVVARQEDGAERALYKVIARAHRQGGGAVVTAADVVAPIESDAAWACTFVASGNNVLLQATGDGANAVKWRAVVTGQFVD